MHKQRKRQNAMIMEPREKFGFKDGIVFLRCCDQQQFVTSHATLFPQSKTPPKGKIHPWRASGKNKAWKKVRGQKTQFGREVFFWKDYGSKVALKWRRERKETRKWKSGKGKGILEFAKRVVALIWDWGEKVERFCKLNCIERCRLGKGRKVCEKVCGWKTRETNKSFASKNARGDIKLCHDIE